MTTENTTPIVEKKVSTRSGLIGGMILILVGLLALAQQFIKADWFDMAFLPGLALIFLAAGILRNQVGLVIPGGILAGIGTGVILESSLSLREPLNGAVILLCIAGGFALITLVSFVLRARSPRTEIAWWALIPGGIMAVIGGAILLGGSALQALEIVGRGWPVILIALGLYILLRRKQLQDR